MVWLISALTKPVIKKTTSTLPLSSIMISTQLYGQRKAMAALDEAGAELKRWLWKASHSRIPAFKDLYLKIKRHRTHILNTIRYGMSNARIEVTSVIFMIWDNFFVGIYTASESVAFYALIRLHHVCSLEGLTATYEVESAALRDMGKSLEPSIITILGTVVFRIIWLATVFRLVPILNLASFGGRNCINFLFGQD